MVTVRENGVARFRVHLSGAGRVQVLGSFTGWQASPVDLRAEGGGWWSGEVRIGPGDHEFQYLVDGSAWLPDYAAHGIRKNRFGLWTSLLHVGEAAEVGAGEALAFTGRETCAAAA